MVRLLSVVMASGEGLEDEVSGVIICFLVFDAKVI